LFYRILLGLLKILIFSILSGLSFGFTFRIGGEPSEAGLGFLLLNFLSQNADSRIQFLLMIVSIVVTILFFYGLVRLFKQIIEKRFAGIVTAILGFLGSFLVVSIPGNFQLMLLGIGSWIIAGIIVSVVGKKIKKI